MFPLSDNKKNLVQCKYNPPRNSPVCINTDGSALGSPGHARVGCILRRQDGSFFRAATSYIGVTSNNADKIRNKNDKSTRTKRLCYTNRF